MIKRDRGYCCCIDVFLYCFGTSARVESVTILSRVAVDGTARRGDGAIQINWLITTALTLVLSTGATKEKDLSYNNGLYHVLSLLVLVHCKCILIN